VLTGLAHRPLVILAFFIQFVAFVFRFNGPGMVAAAISFGLWMPAMLVAAVVSAYDIKVGRALAMVALPYGLWLLIAGRYLFDQVGHLL